MPMAYDNSARNTRASNHVVRLSIHAQHSDNADGGVVVWYNLAQLPSESPLREAWAEGVASHALIGRRISNR
jgi:hypothetical protein